VCYHVSMSAQIAAPRPCRVTAQTRLEAPFLVTELDAPQLAPHARPGQFVMVRIPGALDPLLGRPFSVFDVSDGPEPTRVQLLYSIVGRGTAHMAATPPGGELDLFGPLGTGFSIDDTRPALLVAGGIGIAGLFLLARALADAARPTTLLYGARRAADLVTADRFSALGVTVEAATDDGSGGHHGFVTELLESHLDRSSDAAIYACGPSPMLRRVREIALARDVRCELALEARMACGIGICLGCAIPSATEPGTYRLVCHDGPCMAASEVLP